LIDSFRKVLFIGAHPDDEFACAGTIAKLTLSGAEVDAMVFADCADQLPEGFDVLHLMVEWSDAMALLGVKDPLMNGMRNQHFPEFRQVILEQLYKRRNDGYDLVLLPATSDIHQDHSVIREEGIRAFKHTTILGYEQPQNTVRSTNLAAYVSLSPFLVDLKVKHAATYRSQAHRTYMREDFIRGLAAVRGVQANVDAAEAFEVIRWMM